MRRKTISILLVFVLAVSASTVIWEYESGQMPSSCTEVTFNGSSPFCLGIWKMTFYAIVNYTGSWNVSYLVSNTGLKNVSGAYGGTGYNYTTLSFEVYGTWIARACLTATKQDSSNRTLVFTLGASGKNTSMPFGSVSYCFGEAYA